MVLQNKSLSLKQSHVLIKKGQIIVYQEHLGHARCGSIEVSPFNIPSPTKSLKNTRPYFRLHISRTSRVILLKLFLKLKIIKLTVKQLTIFCSYFERGKEA